MLASQTPPPGQATKPTSAPKHLRLVEFGAAILWTLAIVGAVADITDHFPGGFVVLAAVAAGTVTVIMVQLSISAENRAELVDEFVRLRRSFHGALGAVAAEVEQVSARTDDLTEILKTVRLQREQDHKEFDGKLDSFIGDLDKRVEAAFDAGRRYAEAQNGRERNLSAVRDSV